MWMDVVIPGRPGTTRAWVPASESEDTSRDGWMPISTAAEILGKSFRAVTVMIGNGQLRGLQPAGHTKQKVMADDVYAYIQRNGREVADPDQELLHRSRGCGGHEVLRAYERLGQQSRAINEAEGVPPTELRQPAEAPARGPESLAAAFLNRTNGGAR